MPLTKDRLTAFLYILMRDHVTVGVIEQIMHGHVGVNGDAHPVFSNPWLAGYAGELVKRLTGAQSVVAVDDPGPNWACSYCDTNNSGSRAHCSHCGTEKGVRLHHDLEFVAPFTPPFTPPITIEKAKASCAKGKHWLGTNPDLTPATRCAFDFCDFGKPERQLFTTPDAGCICAGGPTPTDSGTKCLGCGGVVMQPAAPARDPSDDPHAGHGGLDWKGLRK